MNTIHIHLYLASDVTVLELLHSYIYMVLP